MFYIQNLNIIRNYEFKIQEVLIYSIDIPIYILYNI